MLADVNVIIALDHINGFDRYTSFVVLIMSFVSRKERILIYQKMNRFACLV